MCSGIMQQRQQISLCGVYFESLFDYMEQRSSKETPGSPCIINGSFSQGKGSTDWYVFPTHPQSVIIAATTAIDWLPTYSPSVLRTVVKTWKPTPCSPRTRPTLCTYIFSPFYYVPKGSVDVVRVAQFRPSCVRPVKRLDLNYTIGKYFHTCFYTI